MRSHKVNFEQYRPKLKPGRIIPQGPKIVFETSEPFDQIVFPVELADLLVLCSGRFTMREIIEKIYKKQGVVHFKTVFRAIIQLRERGFLENGYELATKNPHERLSRQHFLSRPLVQLPLGQRIFNDKSSPRIFYILSMAFIVGSLLALQNITADLLNVRFLRINNSYVDGVVFLFAAGSVLLTLKNAVKFFLLLSLTGRIYNFRLVLTPLAFYFQVGNESLFLVTNRLFLTLYHLTVSLCHFLFIGFYLKLVPDTQLYPHAIILGFILTLMDLDPFRQSELARFFRTMCDDDGLTQLSNYLKSKSFLSLLDPYENNSRDRSIFLLFSHAAWVWGIAGLWLLWRIVLENSALFVYTLRSEPFPEKAAAGLLLVLFAAVSATIITNLMQAAYGSLVQPLARQLHSLVRSRQSLRRSDWKPDELVESIQNLPLFAYFSDDLIRQILSKSDVIGYKARTKVIIEGDIGKHLFVLLEGSLSVQKHISGEGLKKLGVLYPVSIFGEVAVIEDSLRTADVVAVENAVVLRVPAESIREAAQQSQYIREIQVFKNAIMVNQYFSSAPMFRDLPEEVIHLFTTKSKIEFYSPGQIVFRQGSRGESFYMIVRGSVGVEINGSQVKRIKQGGFFGEIAVIADVPRTATIVAQEPCTLLRIHADAFWEILVQHVEMAMFIESVGEMRMREGLEILKDGQVHLNAG